MLHHGSALVSRCASAVGWTRGFPLLVRGLSGIGNGNGNGNRNNNPPSSTNEKGDRSRKSQPLNIEQKRQKIDRDSGDDSEPGDDFVDSFYETVDVNFAYTGPVFGEEIKDDKVPFQHKQKLKDLQRLDDHYKKINNAPKANIDNSKLTEQELEKKREEWQRTLEWKKKRTLEQHLKKQKDKARSGKRRRPTLQVLEHGVISAEDRKKIAAIEKDISAIRNFDIQGNLLRVIDNDGKMLGDMSKDEALKIAIRRNLDLFQLTVQSDVTICRLKPRKGTQQLQREKQALLRKARQIAPVQISTKELRISHVTSEHDMTTKVTRAMKLLEKGNLVFFVIEFKGSEGKNLNKAQKKQIMDERIEKVKELLADQVRLAQPAEISATKSTFAFVHVDPEKAPPIAEIEEFIRGKSSTLPKL